MQSTDTVAIVRPHKFTPNPETERDNNFQDKCASDALGLNIIAKNAYDEVSNVIERLENNEINVKVFEDEGHWQTPDSVFPNNWFSTHSKKRMVLYPMYAINRRLERRDDVIKDIVSDYQITDINDLSVYEEQEMYLEGTGAMVLDRINDIAYVAESKRSNREVLRKFCDSLKYRSVIFTATDNDDIPIYHTNVMMGIGSGYALICLDSIKNKQERGAVLNSFKATGHEVIDLTIEQINKFSGNVLELSNGQKKILAMSQVGYTSLNEKQIKTIEKYAHIVTFDIPTIELAGGSVRCMLAEIF